MYLMSIWLPTVLSMPTASGNQLLPRECLVLLVHQMRHAAHNGSARSAHHQQPKIPIAVRRTQSWVIRHEHVVLVRGIDHVSQKRLLIYRSSLFDGEQLLGRVVGPGGDSLPDEGFLAKVVHDGVGREGEFDVEGATERPVYDELEFLPISTEEFMSE